MKKIVVIMLAALMGVVLLLPVSAAKNFSDAVVVEAVKGTPTVDGVVSAGEWDNAKVLTIVPNDPIISAHGMTNPAWGDMMNVSAEDYSEEYKLMWDENALYVLTVRHDDEVRLTGNSDDFGPGKSDGSFIFLQAKDSGEVGNENGFSHVLMYMYGNGGGEIGGSAHIRVCQQWQNGADYYQRYAYQNENVKIKSALTDDGALVEIAVPWSVFGEQIKGLNPTTGTEMGICLMPVDYDLDDVFNMVIWFFDGAKCAGGGVDFGGWATLKLTEAQNNQEPEAPETSDAGIALAICVAAVSAGLVIGFKNKKR